MNKKTKHVFIIGAGGSLEYGFPLSDRFIEDIRNDYPRYAKKYAIDMKQQSSQYAEFSDEYKKAQILTESLKDITGTTIDQFLNINQNLLEIGKHAISTIILHKECSSSYPSRNIERDWYSYLFKKLMEGLNTAGDIKKYFGRNITVITFNYDRSLENFLYKNLKICLSNNTDETELCEIINSISIIHVYGKTGYLEWEECEQNYLVAPFGSKDKNLFDLAFRVKDMIKIINEQRKENEEISKTKSLIKEADKIWFLGFGYDKTNLNILGFPENYIAKRIYGTAFKNSETIIENIKNSIIVDAQSRSLIVIKPCDCLELLQDYFFS